MWKSPRLGALFFLLSGNAISAQATIGESWARHLEITIIGPTLIQSGREIKVAVALRNPTIDTLVIPIELGSAGLDNTFDVQGPRGPAALTTYGLALEGKADEASNLAAGRATITQHIVLPGESFQQFSALNDIYDMTPPGSYVIKAQRYLRDGTVLGSNEITVTVTK